jgi:hypothetical protein
VSALPPKADNSVSHGPYGSGSPCAVVAYFPSCDLIAASIFSLTDGEIENHAGCLLGQNAAEAGLI